MNPFALHSISYGVYIVTTWDNGKPTGCVANSAMQITSEPPTIALSLNHDNHTTSCVENSGNFAICVLPENVTPSLIGTFGYRSGRDFDKFEGIAHSVKGNLPVVDEACAYITCKVIDKMETSTHTVFLGQVVDAEKFEGTPMTYAYYHQVIKGKAPKNAPTYIAP